MELAYYYGANTEFNVSVNIKTVITILKSKSTGISIIECPNEFLRVTFEKFVNKVLNSGKVELNVKIFRDIEEIKGFPEVLKYHYILIRSSTRDNSEYATLHRDVSVYTLEDSGDNTLYNIFRMEITGEKANDENVNPNTTDNTNKVDEGEFLTKLRGMLECNNVVYIPEITEDVKNGIYNSKFLDSIESVYAVDTNVLYKGVLLLPYYGIPESIDKQNFYQRLYELILAGFKFVTTFDMSSNFMEVIIRYSLNNFTHDSLFRGNLGLKDSGIDSNIFLPS